MKTLTETMIRQTLPHHRQPAPAEDTRSLTELLQSLRQRTNAAAGQIRTLQGDISALERRIQEERG